MDYARPIIRRQAGPSVFRDVTAEPLETRRLMAGIGMRPPMSYGPPPDAAMVMGFIAARYERQVAHEVYAYEQMLAAEQAPPANGAAGPTTEASPAPTGRAVVTETTAPASSAGASEAAVAVSATTVNAVAVAVNHLPAKASTDDGAGVAQLIADAAPVATSAVPAITAAAAPAGEGEYVFGPFTLQTAAAQSGTPANVTLASLLSGDDSAASAFLLQSQDATYRPRRAAEPTATSADAAVLPRVVTKSNADQAAVLPVPTDVAVKSIWERVILMLAGTMMLVINWVVRRRRQNAALTAIYRRR